MRYLCMPANKVCGQSPVSPRDKSSKIQGRYFDAIHRIIIIAPWHLSRRFIGHINGAVSCPDKDQSNGCIPLRIGTHKVPEYEYSLNKAINVLWHIMLFSPECSLKAVVNRKYPRIPVFIYFR